MAALILCSFVGLSCESDRGDKPDDQRSTVEQSTVEQSTSKQKPAIRSILKRVIDAPALQQYYHESDPQRTPLRIAETAALESTPDLSKFGQPVVYQSRRELDSKDLPHLRFSTLEMTDDSASVHFHYEVEGVHGKAELIRDAGTWKIDELSIAEH
jgi:hypothetical protein